MEASVKRYKNQVHSTIRLTPNTAHKIDTAVQVRANIIPKEKHNRRYPRIEESDYVRVFDKGKGNYTSRRDEKSMERKEIQSQSEKPRYDEQYLLQVGRATTGTNYF